jgi:hypothetical protein
VRKSFLAVVALVLITACKAPPEPIVVEGNMITISNTTGTAWTSVEIWVNDHYRVTRSTIAAGERLQVPLDAFVAGFGQRFDVRRQSVKGIEVSGKKGDQPLKLVWGQGRRTI